MTDVSSGAEGVVWQAELIARKDCDTQCDRVD